MLKKGNSNQTPLLRGKRGGGRLEDLALALELGFVISTPIVGGALLGSWIDKKLSTTPRLTLSLIFFGTFLGIFNLFFLTRKTMRKNKGKK